MTQIFLEWLNNHTAYDAHTVLLLINAVANKVNVLYLTYGGPMLPINSESGSNTGIGLLP